MAIRTYECRAVDTDAGWGRAGAGAGVRPHEPAVGVPAPLGGVATVNGFVVPDPREEEESLLPVPYPLAGDVVVDGSPCRPSPPGRSGR